MAMLLKHSAASSRSDQLSEITDAVMNTKLLSDKIILPLSLVQVIPFPWLYLQFLDEHEGPEGVT